MRDVCAACKKELRSKNYKESACAVGTGWRKKHAEFKRKLKVPTNMGKWSAEHMTLGISTERELDIVDTHAALRNNAMAADQCVDVSQSLGRPATAVCFPCLTTSSNLFAFGPQRLVSSREHLSILGFPKMECGQLGSGALSSLSGEAMAPPVMAAILGHLLMSVNGFWEEERHAG